MDDKVVFETVTQHRKERLAETPDNDPIFIKFMCVGDNCPKHGHGFSGYRCLECEHTERIGLCFYPLDLDAAIKSGERHPLKSTEYNELYVDHLIERGEVDPDNREGVVTQLNLADKVFRERIWLSAAQAKAGLASKEKADFDVFGG